MRLNYYRFHPSIIGCNPKLFNVMNEDILQNINYRIDEALDYGRHLVDDEELIDRIEELKERAERYIKKNPIKSVAMGLISGYIVGKIFSTDD